jgi:hypothetical protein
MTFVDIDAMASRIANALIASGVRTQERASPPRSPQNLA